MFLNALHSGSETTYNELKIVFSKLELKKFFLHLSYTDDYCLSDSMIRGANLCRLHSLIESSLLFDDQWLTLRRKKLR